MRSRMPRPRLPRRGVTLIEMLVAVALLVLMMTVIATIFQAATGAVTLQRTMQELDGELRKIDSTIRQDLLGVTAKMTPPNDPDWNMGYFEYGENTFADNQGEDVDDYLRFTAKAPEGKFFTGRMYVPPPVPITTAAQRNLYLSTQPITIYSQFAEIIYFVRAGNLYRRVFLVAPERQNAAQPGSGVNGSFPNVQAFGGLTVGWQGVNDLSAHPSPTGPRTNPILNTLGDLSNRENRAFSPRYANDFVTNNPATGATPPDNLPDDENLDGSNIPVGDGIPDYLRTFYPQVLSSGLIPPDPTLPTQNRPNMGAMAVPYVFPGSCSQPDTTAAGWMHILPILPYGNTSVFNQNPLQVGDNLPVPTSNNQLQTWWGFPLWQETLSPFWTDPVWQVNVNGGQAAGLQAYPTNNALPPVAGDPFADGAGSVTFTVNNVPPANNPNNTQSYALWQDDLIMTGVRSFDVKAYDNAFPGYVDLGWGNFGNQTPLVTTVRGVPYNTFLQTFAHEGRIPPRFEDQRADAQYPTLSPNIGDSRTTVVRLRRVWDSWSTDYTQVPATAINAKTGLPTGPPFSPPLYPSYPPPYPQALRGIQIQIRVVDPRNERIKTLTIRQDFSDKL